MNKKSIAICSLYATTYYVITVVVGPLSFGALNLRFSNALLGLVPILGLPAVVGHTLGVFLSNLSSPLGPLDLINTVPSFAFSLLLMKMRNVSVLLGLSLYALALSLSVSAVLSYAIGFGFISALIVVGPGIFFVTVVLGYLVYRAFKKINLERLV